MTAKMNIITINGIIQDINDRDLDIIPKFVTSKIVSHDLANAFREIGGREGVNDFLHLLLEVLPDLQIKIEDILATKNRVAFRVSMEGTHRGGKFQSVASTGKKVKFNGNHLYHLEEGKIA
jgi:predicted ester cyclase